MKPDEPVHLKASQSGRASHALARAFQDDPLYVHVFPDAGERTRALQGLFDAVIRYSLKYGEVYTTPAANGAACWLSPGNTEITFWRMLRTGMGLQRAVLALEPKARHRFMALLTYMERIHKRLVTRPHWYLWALGVEPASQGQGIGRKLIHPVLVRSDEERTPCYLETQTERNVAFYQKQGFEVASEGEVPGQGIRVWTMLREPRR